MHRPVGPAKKENRRQASL